MSSSIPPLGNLFPRVLPCLAERRADGRPLPRDAAFISPAESKFFHFAGTQGVSILFAVKQYYVVKFIAAVPFPEAGVGLASPTPLQCARSLGLHARKYQRYEKYERYSRCHPSVTGCCDDPRLNGHHPDLARFVFLVSLRTKSSVIERGLRLRESYFGRSN